MRKLETKEWVAVVVSLFVVGFFFVFGQGLISIFTSGKTSALAVQTPQITTQDVVAGVGDQAVVGSRVTFHYTGRFIDGRVFDSSVTRGEPAQFVLGAGQVISGLDQGMVGMRVGGKRIISIPPELGYGANDYMSIPGNSTLVFEIELLKVEK